MKKSMPILARLIALLLVLQAPLALALPCAHESDTGMVEHAAMAMDAAHEAEVPCHEMPAVEAISSEADACCDDCSCLHASGIAITTGLMDSHGIEPIGQKLSLPSSTPRRHAEQILHPPIV